MSPTIFVAGLFHETHSFLSEKTTMADFQDSIVNFGADVIENSRGNGSPMDGFISYAEEQGWHLLPSVQMAATPSGTVTDDVIDAFENQMFADLENHAAALDGVFLVLHGAMVSESRDDVEGSILRGVKRRLAARGKDIPIVAVLDLHANVSQAMIDNSTALTAYRENPHSDARETAVRGAAMLDDLLNDPALTQLHHPTRYVLAPVGVGSANDPMKSVLALARQIEREDTDIFGLNVMAGYAYADIPDCGFSLNGSTRGDPDKLAAYLQRLEDTLVDHLAAGYPQEDTLHTVLQKADALLAGDGPILLIEPADNIGGGTAGDATGILEPLLETGRKGIVAALNDPGAVAECVNVGLGAIITLPIGAKVDAHHGTPVTFTGRVRHLSDGRFELENHKSHMASMQGIHIDMGSCAVLENDQAIVLLTTHKTAPMDLGHLHSQGIMPEDATYVIVKAAVSHKDAYDPIARASFYVDSPGLCTSALDRLPYRKLKDKIIRLPGTVA